MYFCWNILSNMTFEISTKMEFWNLPVFKTVFRPICSLVFVNTGHKPQLVSSEQFMNVFGVFIFNHLFLGFLLFFLQDFTESLSYFFCTLYRILIFILNYKNNGRSHWIWKLRNWTFSLLKLTSFLFQRLQCHLRPKLIELINFASIWLLFVFVWLTFG